MAQDQWEGATLTHYSRESPQCDGSERWGGGGISQTIRCPREEAIHLGWLEKGVFYQGKLLDDRKAHSESIIHYKGEQRKSFFKPS